MKEGELIGQVGIFIRLQLRVHLLHKTLSPLKHLPYLLNHLGKKVQIALLRRDHSLPIPLVDIGAVIVIQEVVLAHRPHIRIQAFAHLHAELFEGHAFPLGGRLHHLGADGLVQAEAAGKFDRRTGAIPIKIIVDAALLADDQGNLDHDQIQFFAEIVGDVAFESGEGDLCFFGIEDGFVIRGQDFRHFLVSADAGAGEIGGFIIHGG